MYKPCHLMGLELGISVLSGALPPPEPPKPVYAIGSVEWERQQAEKEE